MSNADLAVRFDRNSKKLVIEYDKLDDDQIEYIVSRLKFSNNVIPEVVDKISENYKKLLRRDLRDVRVNPDKIEEFIQQLQLRIDTSEVKDGTGVGNDTASAITATGTQEAFNVKRVTGKKSTIGNNKALDVVKGKQNPTDEGTLVAYFKPPTFAEAFYMIDRMKERYLGDFITGTPQIAPADELDIPQWHHHLVSLNFGSSKGESQSFEHRFGGLHSDSESRRSASRRHIFMRLNMNVDAMYRCKVSPSELARAIENVTRPKNLEAKIIAIPSPLLDGYIDIAVLDIVKYPSFANVKPTDTAAGERAEHLLHRLILSRIYDAIVGKQTKTIRGIKGITEVEVSRDNVNDAIEDIYQIKYDYEDLKNEHHPGYLYAIMPENWKDELPEDVKIHVMVNGGEANATRYKVNPTTKERKLNTNYVNLANELIGYPFIFKGNWDDESVKPLQCWNVDIKAFSRIYQSVGVIAIIRFLSFYLEDEQDSKYELYIKCYDLVKSTRSLVTSTSILQDPSRYLISGNRNIPNSHVTSFKIYSIGSLIRIRNSCIKLSSGINSPKDHNPIFNISHRTNGKIFYKLLEDPNVDIDMSTYSNGIAVAPILGIEAYYTISTFGLISALGDGINPQHASMFTSHRSVTGKPATLTLTAKATDGVGPITASQMNPPIATFSRMSNKGIGESTNTTVGFMCSVNKEEVDVEVKLDAYGRPIIDHFNAQAATPLDLGYKAYVSIDTHANNEKNIKQEIANMLFAIEEEEDTAVKVVFNRVDKVNIPVVRLNLTGFNHLKITAKFVNPSIMRRAIF
jgi:hypothetical protein